jgi:hypothetical protein
MSRPVLGGDSSSSGIRVRKKREGNLLNSAFMISSCDERTEKTELSPVSKEKGIGGAVISLKAPPRSQPKTFERAMIISGERNLNCKWKSVHLEHP